jgi:hypothetical protein
MDSFGDVYGVYNMTQRVGSGKRVVFIILGTAVIILGIGMGAWYAVREIGEQSKRHLQKLQEEAKESQKKMRQAHEESNKQVIAALKKGNAFVSGIRFSDDGGMESTSIPGLQKGEQTACSIPWSVTKDEFARIAKGMTLEEVRVILDLSALHYIPNGPQCRFTLECNRSNRKVTLVFAGNPDVKLVSKSAE